MQRTTELTASVRTMSSSRMGHFAVKRVRVERTCSDSSGEEAWRTMEAWRASSTARVASWQ